MNEHVEQNKKQMLLEKAPPVVALSCGSLEGRVRTGADGRDVLTFYGVPYAAAERFGAPRPVSWQGIRQADRMGKWAFQSGFDGQCSMEQCRADCLNLNIITPDLEGNRPVLVNIHGGAFQNGNTDDLTNPGEGFLKDQKFVYVVPAYRLGVWGWLDVSGEEGFGEERYQTAGNNGLLDLIAALKWVQQHISAFGGDPANVVIAGESAGAKLIGGLMASPLARELFDRVILSSGAVQGLRTKETAKCIYKRFLACAGATSSEELLQLSDAQLLEAQKKLCAFFSTCHFGPVADGILIPEDWREQLHGGTGFTGAALLGCNRNELGFYKEIPDLEQISSRMTESLFGENGVIADAVIAEIPKDLPEETRRQQICDVLSDTMYRTHTYGLANTLAWNGSPVWLYSLEGAEATHASDLTLIWTPENAEEWPGGMEREDALRRKQALIVAYTDFVMEGSGFWHPYTPEVPMIFRMDTVLQEEILQKPDAFMEFPEESLRLTMDAAHPAG